MPGLQKIPKENILDVIRKLGPCQPIDIRKELKVGDTFLIGAMLSELVADGTLIITKTRRGGSPFYSDPTAPESLEKISQYLNEKDRRTLAMLREQKVMREDAQDPLVRVGLKNIDDFSKKVGIDGVVYWRYFLITDTEARTIASNKTTQSEKSSEPEIKEMKSDADSKEKKQVAEIQEKVDSDEKPKKRKNAEKTSTAVSSSEPKAQEPKKKKKNAEPIVMPDGAVMISPQEWLAHDTLYGRIEKIAIDMKIRDARVHKPHSELTCIMTITTPLGAIDTFVHAFNRKFTAEDIKSSMPRARELGLPIIIISVDAIPSKVTAAFKGMPNIVFKRLS